MNNLKVYRENGTLYGNYLPMEEYKNGKVMVGMLYFEALYYEGDVVIPDRVEIIGKGECPVDHIKSSCFMASDKLLSVVIPNSIISIGGNAFADCTQLKAIDIPDSVIQIDQCAFAQCENLKDVKIGSGLKEIHTAVFADCYSLESIDIPDTVIKIHKYAFPRCVSLKRVIVGKDCEIDRNAFHEENDIEIIRRGGNGG